MAVQTASSPTAPSTQEIGNAFVEQYYHILHHSPELFQQLYQDTSVLGRPDTNGLLTSVTTVKGINDRVCSLDYKNYNTEIYTVDAQDSCNDGVLVLVTGCLTGKDDNWKRKFTQSFFLATQEKGYYVLNDLFRFVEESEPECEAFGVNDVPPISLSQAQSVDTASGNQSVDTFNENHATSYSEKVEIIEEKANGHTTDERQPSDDEYVVVEPESHVNGGESSVVAESVAPVASEEEAPQKSYASIVSSVTKKGPTKVYVPVKTKVTSAKTEKQFVNQAKESSGFRASDPAPVNASESRDIEDDVEGYSVYLRKLPMNIAVIDVEAEFKKFGPIMKNGVQVRSIKQQGFCYGFVEFEEFSSMQSAIKASPMTIGGRKVHVEVKTTTTRVGNGGRGCFHNSDNFSGGRGNSSGGRGNSSGGQMYVRNDSFSGRGGQGRRRDGYQQRSWRGIRPSSPSLNSAST